MIDLLAEIMVSLQQWDDKRADDAASSQKTAREIQRRGS